MDAEVLSIKWYNTVYSPYCEFQDWSSKRCRTHRHRSTTVLSSKESACQYRSHQRCGFDPWIRKLPWRRAWQPTPVFLPGESHGKTSLAGQGPKGRIESDMTERLSTHALLFQCCLFLSSSLHSLAPKFVWFFTYDFYVFLKLLILFMYYFPDFVELFFYVSLRFTDFP